MPRNSLIGSGFAVGLETLEGLLFKPNAPFRACLICGEVYQSAIDRNPANEAERAEATIQRQLWANRHAKTHTDREHHLLRISGNSMTPEAAKKLAAYGLIPVGDMIMSEEHEEALLESKPIPIDDAEGR